MRILLSFRCHRCSIRDAIPAHFLLHINTLKRARGLLGQREVPAGEGVVLLPCDSIHCLGMSCTIDVVYVHVDDWPGLSGVVILCETVRPWKIGTNPAGTSMVIELARGAGEAAGLAPGTRVRLLRP